MAFEIDENESGTYTATIVDENLDPITNLDTITLTLYDEASGEIINSRDSQDVLNDNNVTIVGGALTWLLQEEDNAILNTYILAGDRERHIARFDFTWDGKSDSHTVEIDVVRLTTTLPFYGSVSEADYYFSHRLNSSLWSESGTSDKQAALIEATRAIDRLNFRGDRADEDQLLQFPRGSATSVPVAIRHATYENAIQLLEGRDTDLEMSDVNTISQGYSSVRVHKDTTWVPEHIQAGILSPKAWTFLKPYLRDPFSLTLRRTS